MGLSLRGQTSGAVDINAPAVAGDNTITLPDNNGAANQFYKNSGTAGIVAHSSMVEDSSGNVGIGTSSPSTKLEVNGSSDTPSVTFNGSGQAIVGDIAVQLAIGRDTSFPFSLYLQGRGANNTARDIILNPSGGNIGIGTDNPAAKLHVTNNGAANIRIDNTSAVGNAQLELVPGNNTNPWYVYASSARNLVFQDNSASRMQIDSSGRLLVGTSSTRIVGGSVGAKTQIEYAGGTGFNGLSVSATDGGATVYINNAASTAVASGALVGRLGFTGYDGTDCRNQFAKIEAYADSTVSNDDTPGRLVFSTTADGGSSPTERMRITKDGRMLLGTGTESAITSAQQVIKATGIGNLLLFNTASGGWNCINSQVSNGGTYYYHGFLNGSTLIGSIRSENGTTTNFNTSSDYRLKENIIDITGAIDRVKQLLPRRFNFIADPHRTVDGFIAHEAQTVIPEAVHGTKDEVDDDGNAVIQGIDQSKLVPLLTAALQEAITKIETLEVEVQALKG